MKIIVQKFGGTSVSTQERRKLVVQKVMSAINEGYKPIVVVSAMGRSGEPYATDTLLSLIDKDFKETNKRASDLLMCCGEIISTVIMSNELKKSKIAAVPVTGGQAGIITDDNYSNAAVKYVKPENLLKLLSDNEIPVVAGFQGKSENGFFTTLGRGGSDVTASLIGCAVKAEKIEIYTDVDGIMTADPRIVKDAALIENISYNEVFEFAEQGAKVIHPRAVEVAMNGNVPLLIKNTLSDCPGTLINREGSILNKSLITGITSLSGRVQVITKFKNAKIKSSDFLNMLALKNINIDLINVFPKENIFTIDNKDLNKLNSILSKTDLNYSLENNCSKIAIIGSRICGVPGVMARILKAITKEGIEVLQTADSHSTIWCLVKSDFEGQVIKALHREFNLNNK
ncbi:aspartate kinase [Clostridium felsineum]|uniref:Aspartokinase n=1 Tax=Clostridium felsineum TaxID=36839 RepID=A0A1S8MBC0_9CLOT|nr:aspartate kinase [Clostridium felsineum]URZ00705.1 Aspartokinase [Clostridium felsineum]URZ06656.1 Aspartokinase [Clostridium felsineum]URZ11689.1 Aspartokinase [Clostridium felsineum]